MTFSPCSIAPLHEVERRGGLRNRERLPGFGDEREQPSAFPRVDGSRDRAQAVVALSSEERQDLLDRPRAVPAGTATGSHVRSFGGSARTSSFDRRSMTPCNCTVSSSMFDAPPVFQPNVSFLRRAVALREREEAAPERVSDELQQHEEIARPARERRARQQLDGQRLRRVRARAGRHLARELAARAGVILQIVGLVEDQRGPGHLLERVCDAGRGCRS